MGDVPDGIPSPIAEVSALLPERTIARESTNAFLHPDHRRAVRIMTAAALQWRADISYRTAGPRIIVSGFTADQVAEIERARRLYALVLELLGKDDDSFIVGLGLMGAALDEQRKDLIDECRMRMHQIALGKDWTASAVEWPLTYLEDIQSQVAEMLRIEGVAGGLNAIKSRTIDLQAAIDERSLAVLQAEQEAEAGDRIVEAESFTLDALNIEEATAAVRKQIAEFRTTEAKYRAAAHRYAAAGAGQKAEAREALLQIELETERQLAGQLKILEEQIKALVGDGGEEGTLPRLRRQIGEARQNLRQFESDARDRHRQRQSHRALISIIKKIGSLVSIYFTGVDLVAIAETAIQAVKSAQSGDWAGAIMHAKQAGDLATGGKFTEALKGGIAAAERCIGNVMADSLGDAALVLKEKLGIELDEATQRAIDAVSRQAFRLGVSFLAKETGTRDIFLALGVPDPEPGLIQNLREAAERQLVEAGWQAFKKRGEEAVKGVAVVLRVDTSQAESEIRKLLKEAQETGRSLEKTMMQLIADVEKSNPRARGILAELKNELLEQRDRLAERISREVRKGEAEVAEVLDELTGKVLAATGPNSMPLPPIAMPEEVVRAIVDFRRKTELARAKIGFLTTPGKADELANQLSEAENDQHFNDNLTRVVGDLNKNIDDAAKAMEDAENDLVALKAQLDETKVKEYVQHFRRKAAELEELAARSDAQAAAEMGNAAAEAVLAAEQQIRIEEFGIEIAQRRRAAQQSLVEARRSLAAAARIEIEIRKIALKRAERALVEWTRNGELNPDQQRIAQAVGVWCLTKANTLLAQWWQLLNLYELSERLQRLPGAPPQAFAPTFLVPTRAQIELGRELLKLAQTEWNIGLVEDPRPITTLQFADFSAALNVREQDRLRDFFTAIGNEPYPCLKFQTRSDLTRLLGGVMFQIRRAGADNPDAPFDYVKNLPFSAFTDSVAANGRIRQQTGTTYLESEAFPAWDDAGSPRIRLLGVLLKVVDNGGLRPGTPLKMLMRQEAEPDIWVRDLEHLGARVRITVPLQPMKSEDDLDRGVFLSPGAFRSTQWQTRPLFGTYSVRLANAMGDFLRPADFKVEIHFVALGRP